MIIRGREEWMSIFIGRCIPGGKERVSGLISGHVPISTAVWRWKTEREPVIALLRFQVD